MLKINLPKPTIAFKKRVCPDCHGSMGRDAKERCQNCQRRLNIINYHKRNGHNLKSGVLNG